MLLLLGALRPQVFGLQVKSLEALGFIGFRARGTQRLSDPPELPKP